MSTHSDWVAELDALSEKSGQFSTPAFLWIFRALDHARQSLKREGHITGRELLDAHRELALETFGPMAFEVCCHWGFRCSEDLGAAVFELVEAGLLGKTDDDRQSDFSNGYDFEDVFVRQLNW